MSNQHSKCDDCYKTHLPENHDRTILPSEAFSEGYVPEFNQASEGELEQEVRHMFASAWQDGVHHLNPEYLRRDSVFTERVMKLIEAYLTTRVKEAERLARIDERKSVALDNYSGHTFSEDTNWEGKFQKFIDNNERRIEALTTTTNGKAEL